MSDEWWKVTEALVRKALWQESRLPGPPPIGETKHGMSWGLDQEVFSSESPRGRKAGWGESSPWKVYVIMECCLGPLREQGFTADTTRGWNFLTRATKRLVAENPAAFEDAGWESYNAAVAYVWVKPRLVA